MKVKVRSYASPKVVLLAFDWEEGKDRKDFLGFAISRSPGFDGKDTSWLPNRIGFEGPIPKGQDPSSNKNPIQKFMWWDAKIDDKDTKFTYIVYPVTGTKDLPVPVEADSQVIDAKLPPSVNQDGIGTWFNRAVISSQGFKNKFPKVTMDNRHEALQWLSNGLESVVPDFVSNSDEVVGAVYHLTDEEWIIPALLEYKGKLGIDLYWKLENEDKKHGKPGEFVNSDPVDKLNQKTPKPVFNKRTKIGGIMHNKFLVRLQGGKPTDLLAGSANFTTEGLSIQANLLHTIKSQELAKLYHDRYELLTQDLETSKTAIGSKWSDYVNVGNSKIRAFFCPEPTHNNLSNGQIIDTIKKRATKSILFCLFCPTDIDMLNAIFERADKDKLMMFGLVNSIDEPKEGAKNTPLNQLKTTIYHRSQNDMDVFSYDKFGQDDTPEGFWWEVSTLPGLPNPYQIFIHHKFIIIDAETDNPTIYTGSANLSQNSMHNNDENILEMTNCPELAQLYLAEFFRLYEHYRARSSYDHKKRNPNDAKRRFELKLDNSWASQYYDSNSAEFKSRISMVAPP